MIFYFSGTGNSKWIAEELAKQINDTAIDLITVAKPLVVPPDTFGLVFPIYAWGIPEPVRLFLKSTTSRAEFSFTICTCGEDAGHAMRDLKNFYPFNSTYSIVMPNNYIMGFDVELAPVIQEKFANAKVQLLTIAKEVQNQHSVYKVTEGRLPWLKSQFISPLFDRFARRTKPFYATSECISCGLCARNCPTQTIKLIDGKPHWGDHCYQCTACINHCPVQAIQFEKSTIPRGRYFLEMHQDHP